MWALCVSRACSAEIERQQAYQQGPGQGDAMTSIGNCSITSIAGALLERRAPNIGAHDVGRLRALHT